MLAPLDRRAVLPRGCDTGSFPSFSDLLAWRWSAGLLITKPGVASAPLGNTARTPYIEGFNGKVRDERHPGLTGFTRLE
jgi:hypothetical protein